MAAGRHLGKFQMAISPERVVRSTLCLILGWGFRGWRIEWTYFRLDQIQDGGWPPSWKILNGHIWATDHPIRFVFGSTVGFSRSADQMDQIQSGSKFSKMQGLSVGWRIGRRSSILHCTHTLLSYTQPSCIILNRHISEAVHPVQFVFGSGVKVQEKIMRDE